LRCAEILLGKCRYQVPVPVAEEGSNHTNIGGGILDVYWCNLLLFALTYPKRDSTCIASMKLDIFYVCVN